MQRGGKVSPLRLFSSPRYVADLGAHTMPIRKFQRVREAIEASGIPARIDEPSPATDADLLRVHTAEYVRAVSTGEPRALAESQKFPWSPELAASVRYTNGGCIAGLYAALEEGIAGNLASGFHHAHADHGEGFCTFHGLAVAYEHARQAGRISRALVVDLDLHYGNGTASLCATRPGLFNLSIYGSWYKANTAYREVDQERAPDTENAWSVPVPKGSNGEVYLRLIAEHLAPAIERARPEILLYQAGADPYREDPYSPLDIGLEDLRARDELVFSIAKAQNVPVCWVLAGGYTKDIAKIVAVHTNTFLASAAVYR
jgi:acetoin utilization deacetylase AcuC-like enzyme